MSDMLTSESVAELAVALCKAQSEIKAASKDRANPFFNSRYATLDAIWEACRGPLTSHGLSVLQGASSAGKTVTVTTMLLHTSGQWVKSPLTLDGKDASPQAVGSAITYARRYGLGAMVGVTAEEDDDANAAQPSAPKRPLPRSAPKTLPNAPAGGGMPPQSEEETKAEADAAFPPLVTDAAEEDRAALVDDLGRLGEKLKMDATAKRTYVKTYLGGADPQTADLSALSDLVSALRARAGEPKWGGRA
jgi:hypothetical protein